MGLKIKSVTKPVAKVQSAFSSGGLSAIAGKRLDPIFSKPLDPKSYLNAAKGVAGGLKKAIGGAVGDLGGGSGGDGGYIAPADPLAADIRETQKAAMAAQRDVLNQRMGLIGKGEEFVRANIAGQMAGLGGAAQDTQRSLNESIARRGLTGSSVGLGAQKSAMMNLAKQSNLLRASIPQLIEEEKDKRLRAYGDVAQNIVSGSQVPIQMQDVRVPGVEKGPNPLLGGILGLGGALIGGKLGGSAGAGVGAGVGSSLGNAFSSRR